MNVILPEQIEITENGQKIKVKINEKLELLNANTLQPLVPVIGGSGSTITARSLQIGSEYYIFTIVNNKIESFVSTSSSSSLATPIGINWNDYELSILKFRAPDNNIYNVGSNGQLFDSNTNQPVFINFNKSDFTFRSFIYPNSNFEVDFNFQAINGILYWYNGPNTRVIVKGLYLPQTTIRPSKANHSQRVNRQGIIGFTYGNIETDSSTGESYYNEDWLFDTDPNASPAIDFLISEYNELTINLGTIKKDLRKVKKAFNETFIVGYSPEVKFKYTYKKHDNHNNDILSNVYHKGTNNNNDQDNLLDRQQPLWFIYKYPTNSMLPFNVEINDNNVSSIYFLGYVVETNKEVSGNNNKLFEVEISVKPLSDIYFK